MDHLIIPLLMLVALVSLASLVIQFVQWFMHDGLSKRVAKLEAHSASALTQKEVREIYEQLSTIKGQLKTNIELMHAVQKHLLENDR